MTEKETAQTDALKGIHIPPQPRLLQDIQNAGDDLEEMARLIASDPGTSAAVLKTVNSPFYGLRREISSIKQAVMLLGMDPVKNLVRGLQLRATTTAQKSKVDLGIFWDTSQDVANIAAAVSKQLQLNLADECYTLGLFSNCGALLLAMHDDNYLAVMQKAYSVAHKGICDAEHYLLQHSHAELGAKVAETWQLAEHIREGIRLHHHPQNVLGQNQYDEKFQNILAAHKIAEHFAMLYKRLGKQNEDKEWNTHSSLVLEQFRLSDVDFEDLRDEVREILGSLPS